MDYAQDAQRVMTAAADALVAAASRMNSKELNTCVELILETKGRVVVFGIGKSGFIARKFVSTLSSTGTPALFLHPAEASHGDLGMVTSGDLFIGISQSGNAPEFHPIYSFAKQRKIPLLSITGNSAGELAQASVAVLDSSVVSEACHMGLAPTTSTTLSLTLADALAVCVSRAKKFSKNEFAEFHPGGGLGRRLLTKVADVMHTGAALPLVQPTLPMKDVVSQMTKREVRGVAGVINSDGELIGIVTDGDIRRAVDKGLNFDSTLVSDIMSSSPKVIDCHELAEKALFYMREFQIKNLFAVDSKSDSKKRPVGHIEYLDLLNARII